jgi:hypothetical protein
MYGRLRISFSTLALLISLCVNLPQLGHAQQLRVTSFQSAIPQSETSIADKNPSKAIDIQVPSGKLRQTTDDDFLPHKPDGNFYNEFWSYFIKLDNGTQLLIEYSIGYFGNLKDPVTGAQMAIANFKGEDYVVRREYPIDLKSFDPETYYFRLHPERDIWFKGKLPEKHEIFFRTHKDDILYDVKLKFTDIEPGLSWGDGEFVLDGKDRVGMFIHIPSARVEGHIAMNGDSTQVQGVAYMDHTYQTRLATDLISKGYRFIIDDPNKGIAKAGHVLEAQKKSTIQPIGYCITRVGTESWRLLRPSIINAEGSIKVDKTKIDDNVTINFANGPNQVMKQDKQYLSYSLLSELGGLKKFLAKKYLGGELFKILGTARTEDGREVDYNYFVVD